MLKGRKLEPFYIYVVGVINLCVLAERDRERGEGRNIIQICKHANVWNLIIINKRCRFSEKNCEYHVIAKMFIDNC